MTTVLSKAQKLIQKIRSNRHDIEDWPKDSLDAFLDLEQAIAQEQAKLKHKMPARGCYTCKHEDERIGVPPCLTCSGKNWEPKP